MSFLQKIKGIRLFRKERDDWDEPEEEEEVLSRGQIDMHDAVQRKRYINDCLDQMQEASRELEQLKGEYSTVTEYLTDMEEIEALPAKEKRQLEQQATRLLQLENEKNQFRRRESIMPDSQFEKMSRIEDEAEDGIGKIRDAEIYQDKIRRDLNRLEGEKHACHFRRNELLNLQMNLRGMTAICITATIVCVVLLFLFQVLLEMEVRIGYLVTIGAWAVAVTVIYVKYSDASSELKKGAATMNKLILLQNRVKIRYVNNTNLLDYYYLKFDVKSAGELETLWERFIKEKESRAQFNQVKDDYSFYEKELTASLNRFPLKHPGLWLRQIPALVDGREMVEIRHALITRRQSLRKQMEYNNRLAEEASVEVKEAARDFPQYAREISEMVENY